MNEDYWIILYIFFEINLIKELGYDVNLKQYFEKIDEINQIKKIEIDGYAYEIPVYLILKKNPEKINNNLIRKSLYFTRNIILNKFFLPNNIRFPKSRVILENYFN
jgi:DNA repair protein RecO (recombination protein O)